VCCGAAQEACVIPSITLPTRLRHSASRYSPPAIRKGTVFDRLLVGPVALLLALGVAAKGSGQALPPRVAGIGIGSSAFAVRTALGKPDKEEESLGMRFWDYTQRQLTVIWTDEATGVHGLVLRGARSGALGGAAVGDSDRVLLRAWGPPTRVRQEGRFFDYVGDRWVMSAEIVAGRVVQLALLRSQPLSHSRGEKQ